jgi:serine/threonine protein kinase
MVHFQKFGKYEIVRKLGRSMTDVYLALDTSIDRPAVLKVIEQSRDEFTQLLIEAERRGALIQKQLHAIDPRIVEIYECSEQDGCFYVAMQYVEGRTVAEILQAEHRIEPRRAARYAAEICSQLKTLHSFVSDVDGRKTAVVHGDIKPSNIQIGPNDELKLLDFGIAKVITFTRNLTHHNLGSPSYCSPERVSRAQVDQHADLWAVGVSLYEMVSGAPPYQAQSTRKLENLIQSRRPPRALPEDCPPSLKAIVAKALAADLEHRYPSAEAFESDLRALLDHRPTIAETERRSSWDANATVEKHPPEAKTVPRVAGPRPPATKSPVRKIAVRSDLTNVAIALLAGILAGLLVFIPVGYYYRFRSASERLRGSRDYAHEDAQVVASDWNLYQDLRHRNQLFGQWTPVSSLDRPLHANLVSAADNILERFRNSSDEELNQFDWAKARLCLLHALELEPSDSKARGKLALCDGYLNLMQNPNPPKAAFSIDNFRQAESYLPHSPDPHLALARVYVYAFHNIGEALAEFHQAEQLGYRSGPKEAQQKADGYLFRAEWELARAKKLFATSKQQSEKWCQLARDDIERARALDEPIAGFSNVSTNLQQIYQDRDQQMKLQMQYARVVASKPHSSKRYTSHAHGNY